MCISIGTSVCLKAFLNVLINYRKREREKNTCKMVHKEKTVFVVASSDYKYRVNMVAAREN
jgi:hypothetical protein